MKKDEMKKRRDEKSISMILNKRLKEKENLRKESEVVKGKVLTKRNQFLIRKPVRDFLADNRLIPTSEESIGRGWGSEWLINFLFTKSKIDDARKKSQARIYQESQPEYWTIMKKYLRRFYFIRSSRRQGQVAHLYDFDAWDYPRADNYPTHQEQNGAWDKLLKRGKDKLNKRERYALETFFEKNKEEQNERLYDTLSSVHQFGWSLPELNFRYLLIFEPDLKEFWEWTGLDVNENLKFFLSGAIVPPSQYERKHKVPKHSLFDRLSCRDYAELRSELIKAGVPKSCFELIENFYVYDIQLPEILETLSRIIRPLFLVAHFLKKEDATIYDYHQKLTRIYISAIESGNDWIKRWVIGEVTQRRFGDFLFDSVWQDFLFDRRRYLQKPKLRKGGKGRPPKIVNYALVYVVKNELKKYETRLSKTVDLTTAEVINSLLREKRFNLTRSSGPKYYYNLGAENVRGIYGKAKEYFEKEIPK